MYNILIVDDESMIVQGIMAKLKYLNIRSIGQIHTATNYKDTKKILQAYPIHLILTDINMPDKSGIELIRDIKSQYDNIKFMVISGYEDYTFVRESFKLDVLDYLVKPINSSELREQIQKALSIVQIETEKTMLRAIESYRKEDDLSHLKILEETNILNMQHGHQIVALFKLREGVSVNRGDMEEIFSQNLKGEYTYLYSNDQCIYYLLNYQEFVNLEEIKIKLAEMIKYNWIKDVICYISSLDIGIIEEVVQVTKLEKNLFLVKDSVCCWKKEKVPSNNNTFFKNNELAVFIERLEDIDYKECDKYLYNWFGVNGKCYSMDSLNQFYEYIKQYIRLKEIKDLEIEIKNLSEFLYVSDFYMYIKKIILQCCHKIIHDEIEEESKINIAKRIIQTNYMKDLSMADVASQLEMNYSYLSQMFKKEVGMSFKKYLLKVKMEKAVWFLKHSTLKIKMVGTKVGYHNEYHFSKMFKQYFGVSPQNFRNQKD